MSFFLRTIIAFVFFTGAALSFAGDVTTYTVVTRGTTKPIAYFDEKDRLTGIDIELLREIEKRNPQVKFEFKTMTLAAGFVALDTNQADIIAHHMAKNPARAEKYLFPTEANTYILSKLVVRENDDSIKTLDDLDGKRLITTSTSEMTRQLLLYIKEHGLNVDVIYTDQGADEAFNAIVTGRADATTNYEYVVDTVKKELGLKIKVVGPVVLSTPTYFILRNSPENKKLAAIIDATLKELRADGTLAALSVQFLGADYSRPFVPEK